MSLLSNDTSGDVFGQLGESLDRTKDIILLHNP